MYRPQHYLLHERPIFNEIHCRDIIRVNNNSIIMKRVVIFIFHFVVMVTEELAGML